MFYWQEFSVLNVVFHDKLIDRTVARTKGFKKGTRKRGNQESRQAEAISKKQQTCLWPDLTHNTFLCQKEYVLTEFVWGKGGLLCWAPPKHPKIAKTVPFMHDSALHGGTIIWQRDDGPILSLSAGHFQGSKFMQLLDVLRCGPYINIFGIVRAPRNIIKQRAPFLLPSLRVAEFVVQFLLN